MTPGTMPAETIERQAAALARYRLLDGPKEPDLQTVVELAAQLCEVPIAVLFVLDADRQQQIAAIGIEVDACRRDESMCSVALVNPEPTFIEDARLDERFAENPFVTGKFQRFRFYGSCRLCTPDGFVLGTLCVFDQVPRQLTEQQKQGLQRLGRLAVDVLELRRHGFLVADLLQEQQRTRIALEQTNATLRHFAAQVAHDLSSPLTGVLACAAELRSLPAVAGDADARWCTERVASSAQRMTQLIDDVLRQATTDAAGHRVDVDLAEVAREVIEDLAVPIKEAGADLTVGALPVVTGEVTQWRILLQNLIGNAVKYRHPQRPCQVSVGARTGDDCLRVCVADNGIGIPADQREVILEPFTRLDPTGAAGFGIGLSTCARITYAHGGRLEFGETPGGGTTVCVVLPVPS
ncbi:signal transduction histidine kinase [Actinoplanes octamycinicus]|uniref:Sensor-like histidine kinase SenX3 n=1 Tax=Actinoplanes octamycinicus TaxID=135948 RepID=A0A7W7H1B6_9ACTN|nr:GAF domain-containing sensor histidine kinase [Actinoplanes octamycinicus]MBB4742151.1 signal transduction histidine kinase [Actinoplanes octamycinicus]GIE60003.1 sensor histidine kinase [Actinoplanes octamycinicus]